MCHVTSHKVRQIAFSTIFLSNCWLNFSNSLPLQPMSKTCKASTYKTKASKFSSFINFLTLRNIIKLSNPLSEVHRSKVESLKLELGVE